MNRRIYSMVWAVVAASALFSLGVQAASPSGEKLFEQHCVACHGNAGKGGVGVPLSLPDFINTVDDHYLNTSIRHGRPGRIMPSFADLTNTQVAAIVGYMRSWTGKKPAPYPTVRVKGDPARGAKLFQQHCAACHGANGEGGHGTGVTFSRPRNLPILAPALNNEGFLAAAQDELIRQTLLHGRRGTPMGSFLKAGLSRKDIDDVVSHVRSFEKDHANKPDSKPEPPVLIVESPYSIEQTVNNLKQAVVSANMRLIRIQTLDDGFVPKGKENRKQMIVYSCGFNFLNEAMKIDPRVGVFLPCRVTVTERNGKTIMMTVNPKRLAPLFNNNELDKLCGQMRERYTNLLEEAAL